MAPNQQSGGDGHESRSEGLEHPNPTFSQRVLKSLPEHHADFHGALHHDDVSEGNGEDGERQPRHDHGPFRRTAEEVGTTDNTNDEQDKCRRQAEAGAQPENSQAAARVGRGSASALAAQQEKERADRQYGDDPFRRIKREQYGAQPRDAGKADLSPQYERHKQHRP